MKKQMVTLMAMSVSLFSMVDAQNQRSPSSYQQNSAFDQANQQSYYNQNQQNPYYQTNQQNQDKRSKNQIAQETPFTEESTTIYPTERGSTSSITQQSRNDRQFQSRGYPDQEQANVRSYNQANGNQTQLDQDSDNQMPPDAQDANDNNPMYY